MNIDDLTIGQARNIAATFGGAKSASGPSQRLVGKYVIIRSRNEALTLGQLLKLMKQALFYQVLAAYGITSQRLCRKAGMRA